MKPDKVENRIESTIPVDNKARQDLKLAGQKARVCIILFITETSMPEARPQLKWAFSARHAR